MKTFYKLLAIVFIVSMILTYSQHRRNQLKLISMSADYKLLLEITKLKQEIKVLKANSWY
jgi:hypothetical protein